MKKVILKKIIIAFIIFLVVVILFSNLGQNFKDDIFSVDNTVQHSAKINTVWVKSKSYENYVEDTSDYIAACLRDNNVKPFNGDKYFSEWNTNTPSLKYQSYLEVVTRYGRIVKKYQYNKDFFESYKGIIKPGVIVNKAFYLQDIDSMKKNNSQIILFDGYKGKSYDEILNIDKKLLTGGVRCVLSPAFSDSMHDESGLSDKDLFLPASKEGLVKLIVNYNTFEDIKKYIKKGYSLKIKSGSEINASKLKNVYGVIQGENPSYKPLVIACYIDGEYKLDNIENNDYMKYSITPSIMLECIRSLKLQRPNKPDRTIIFAFLSGYPKNKEDLENSLDINSEGDVILLDGFGVDNRLMMSYYKPSKYFIENIGHFAKRNDIKIISKNNFPGSRTNFVHISALETDGMRNFDYQNINRSGRFLLSFIGEECFNLDFLSGNIPEIRLVKEFIRENTLIIGLITLVSLILVVFKFQE